MDEIVAKDARMKIIPAVGTAVGAVAVITVGGAVAIAVGGTIAVVAPLHKLPVQ